MAFQGVVDRLVEPGLRGGPGAYFLSQAEKQASVLNPGYGTSVSRDMCLDCISWFQSRARQLGVPIFVSDPAGVSIAELLERAEAAHARGDLVGAGN
ncbi:hypothetical protein [Streptomyces sp. 3214.6]|uniref:hypothetical protein n=1 Tax=Streptomyces sp. 3214.6 TaxID=1882757 RepID=UPI0009A6B0F2|nr:hypothetical protein [Streptomyces sp. 3214.6]